MGFIEIHRLLASWAHSFLLDGKEEMVSQASRLIGPSCCAVSAWKMDDQVPSASSAAGEVLLSSFNFPSGPYCNFPIRLLALSPPPHTHTFSNFSPWFFSPRKQKHESLQFTVFPPSLPRVQESHFYVSRTVNSLWSKCELYALWVVCRWFLTPGFLLLPTLLLY